MVFHAGRLPRFKFNFHIEYCLKKIIKPGLSLLISSNKNALKHTKMHLQSEKFSRGPGPRLPGLSAKNSPITKSWLRHYKLGTCEPSRSPVFIVGQRDFQTEDQWIGITIDIQAYTGQLYRNLEH
jgi:hypothetical protein